MNMLICIISGVVSVAFIILSIAGLLCDGDEVIVSDGVDFNSFMSEYEIIDHRGDIYTVKEKNK